MAPRRRNPGTGAEDQRIIDVGHPECHPPFADTSIKTSRFTLLSFFPLVRVPLSFLVRRTSIRALAVILSDVVICNFVTAFFSTTLTHRPYGISSAEMAISTSLSSVSSCFWARTPHCSTRRFRRGRLWVLSRLWCRSHLCKKPTPISNVTVVTTRRTIIHAWYCNDLRNWTMKRRGGARRKQRGTPSSMTEMTSRLGLLELKFPLPSSLSFG